MGPLGPIGPAGPTGPLGPIREPLRSAYAVTMPKELLLPSPSKVNTRIAPIARANGAMANRRRRRLAFMHGYLAPIRGSHSPRCFPSDDFDHEYAPQTNTRPGTANPLQHR